MQPKINKLKKPKKLLDGIKIKKKKKKAKYMLIAKLRLKIERWKTYEESDDKNNLTGVVILISSKE